MSSPLLQQMNSIEVNIGRDPLAPFEQILTGKVDTRTSSTCVQTSRARSSKSPWGLQVSGLSPARGKLRNLQPWGITSCESECGPYVSGKKVSMVSLER